MRLLYYSIGYGSGFFLPKERAGVGIMKSIVDDIYRSMREGDLALSSRDIVTRFFKIPDATEEVSARIVRPLLGGDARFFLRDDRWRAREGADLEELPLTEVPFVLFAMEDVSQDTAVSGNPFTVIDSGCAVSLFRGGAAEQLGSIRDVLGSTNAFVFVPADRRSLSRLRRVYRMISPLPLELTTLSVKNLMQTFYPERRVETWEDILAALDVIRYESHKPASKVRTLVQVFEHILEAARERSIETAAPLIELSSRMAATVDWSRFGFNAADVRGAPRAPGMYRFTDREGKLLYVGKTGNLRARLRSYFRQSGLDGRGKRLLEKLHGFDYVELGSDLEALVEEQKSISRDAPLLNTRRTIPGRAIDTTRRVIVLPSSREGVLKLYFLSNSCPLLEQEYDGSDMAGLVGRIGRVYQEGEDVIDPLKTLVLSYLKRYGDRINVIELERYARVDQVVEILNRYRDEFDSLLSARTTYVS